MKILFLGDFFYNYNKIEKDIEKISEFIKKNNYKVILNLETVIGDVDKSNRIRKRGPNLLSNEITINVLKKLNVIGVCLANNHIMDYGENGLLKTIELLDAAGIKHTGAGKDIYNSLIPISINFNGKIVNIFNFGWNVEETVYAANNRAGCAPRKEKIILNSINNKKADINIVSMHWGFEFNRFPQLYDIDLAHKLIENDVDLVIGHHPHCIQAKEKYNNKSIYYSLGNFYFSSMRDNYKKVFNEKISNQCDYGLGVVYSLENGNIEEIMLYYDTDKKETIIINVNNDILLNITNTNYKSYSFYKKSKNNNYNITPILTTNKILNFLKLSYLYGIFFVKKVGKLILGRK